MKLKTVTRTQGANLALKDGVVKPQGFELEFEEVPVLVQAFRRMVRGLEFDVCEMAFTTYLCAREHGKRFTAIPVFLVRGFHHAAMCCAAGGPAGRPRELEGRRVGVNRGYTVTTGVWARGILAEEHGVDLKRVTWVPSSDDHVAEYRPPSNVEAPSPGADLLEMALAGELAAVVGLAAERPGLVPLVADPEAAALRALRERGFYPINHLVVVKDELLEENPRLGPALFEAFAEAKIPYLERLRSGGLAEPKPAEATYRQVMEATGGDPLPYGVSPNEAMITKLIDYCLSQQILRERPSIESLFAPGTSGLTG